MQKSFVLLLTVLLQFTGCAITPEFDRQQAELKLTPADVSASPQSFMGKKIIWSGMILLTKNLQNSTQLEVLAYPAGSSYRPQTKEKPIGRFILINAGYLEKAEYAEGRYISVQGTLNSTTRNKIGDTDYVYPVIKADKLFLWPKNFENQEPTFQFGFGINISR